MVYSDYNVLKDWMFGKLTSLLENIEPNPEYPILKCLVNLHWEFLLQNSKLELQ